MSGDGKMVLVRDELLGDVLSDIQKTLEEMEDSEGPYCEVRRWVVTLTTCAGFLRNMRAGPLSQGEEAPAAPEDDERPKPDPIEVPEGWRPMLYVIATKGGDDRHYMSGGNGSTWGAVGWFTCELDEARVFFSPGDARIAAVALGIDVSDSGAYEIIEHPENDGEHVLIGGQSWRSDDVSEGGRKVHYVPMYGASWAQGADMEVPTDERLAEAFRAWRAALDAWWRAREASGEGESR